MTDIKICRRCNESKSLDKFYADKTGKHGKAAVCKFCVAKRNAEKRDADPEAYRQAVKNKNIWQLYKLTPEQYEERTKDGCEVCGSMENLCIDHDHSCCPGMKSCGKCLRGTLCQKCNVAEGMLNSDANRALALAAYILKNESMNLSV